MLEISFDKSFVKALKKILRKNPSFEYILSEKLHLFRDNPYLPVLKTHKLTGRLKDLYAFSIDYDCRIIFYFFENKAVFIDIGKHDDVY